MWTTTLAGIFYTVLLLGLAYMLHAYIGIRRSTPDRATAIRTFGGWLKLKWDWVAAIVIAGLPVAWSMALDSIIIVANFFANVFPALAGLDLSAAMLSDDLKHIIQAGGLLAPPIRDAIETTVAKFRKAA